MQPNRNNYDHFNVVIDKRVLPTHRLRRRSLWSLGYFLRANILLCSLLTLIKYVMILYPACSLAGSVQGGTGPGCGGAGTFGLAWETALFRDWYTDTVGEEGQWCSH